MIRSARAADAPGIAAIWNPIIRDTVVTFWPTEREPGEIAEMIAARQSQGHAFLVAEGTEGITGFAATTQFRGGAGYARTLEHTVHVAPHCRGQGLGRALMAAIQDHSRQGGARNLIGAVTASNGESLTFHARLGFTEWGRIPNAGWKFGQFHDLVFVGKDLTGG
ncbi:GNAT family N-acetyltransferase [uncultured Paracoccus sp.]|uniref:GNAT family N-acetyltransferase n=1 Tax=uncultured Paracoccus sp. TaxID=189685 RepID=UPI002622AD68|nr:GNAT family N-acetyltransferase [uncultured Paracoccus sp.]